MEEDRRGDYHTVGDVEQIRIHGLERTRFVDKVEHFKEKTAGDAPIGIVGEIDRVYLDTTAPCTVDDPVLGRQIRIEKDHSLATVVWNPGYEKGRGVADIGAEAWRSFVCVETANCRPHVVRLAPIPPKGMIITVRRLICHDNSPIMASAAFTGPGLVSMNRSLNSGNSFAWMRPARSKSPFKAA